MHRTTARFTAASLLAMSMGLAASTDAMAQSVALEAVASSLPRPLFLTQPQGDARLFIVEQRGTGGSTTTGGIRVVKNGALLATPYITIGPVRTGSEQGLLGLAFDPNFATNGWFWVNYTRNSDGATVIERIRVSSPGADVAAVAERQIVLTVAQPFANHNGGWIAFGPDGFLYISMGDGGSGNDPGNRSQDNNNLLGKMLRLDVNGADNITGNTDDDGFTADANRLYTIPAGNAFPGGVGGLAEIFYTGLRNPWRSAFDRQTGDLWIADVGQNVWEEVNFAAAPLTPGVNFGWRPFEGFVSTNLGGGNGGPYTPPLFTYIHSGTATAPTNRTGCSITGGYVYRGCLNPTLRGKYIFADYCQGWIQAYDPATGTSADVLTGVGNITSFGEDNSGELYVITASGSSGVGSVRRLIPSASGLVDCNSNARQDACDIALGFSQDLNNNGIPDECGPCIADVDGEPGVDFGDFLAFFNCYDQELPCANINGLDGVEFGDFLTFFNAYDSGC
jgi:glucose/arabinose dehydrogenase